MMYYSCDTHSHLAYCPPINEEILCLELAHLGSNSTAPNAQNSSVEPQNIHHHILRLSAPRSFSLLATGYRTNRSPNACRCRFRSFAAGGSDSSTNGWLVLMSGPGEDVLAFFPPQIIMEVKALACELPQ